MRANPKFRLIAGFLTAAVALSGANLGCGSGDPEGAVLFVDAEYNPVAMSDTTGGIHESSLSVAQTFTVLRDGKLEEFRIVVTQGTPGGAGMISIDVRPLLGTGEPETTDVNSIITPITVDTATLPLITVEDFTIFDVGTQPGRQVLAGEQYAIVVRFLSRDAGTMNAPIATVYGRTGDEYVGGSGSLDPDGLGFMNNTTDYFFRTFVLQ